MAERKIYYNNCLYNYSLLPEKMKEFERGLTKKEAIVDSVEEKEYCQADGFCGPAPLGISEIGYLDYMIHIKLADERCWIRYRKSKRCSLEGLLNDMGIEGDESLYFKTKKLIGKKILAYFSGNELVGLSAPEE